MNKCVYCRQYYDYDELEQCPDCNSYICFDCEGGDIGSDVSCCDLAKKQKDKKTIKHKDPGFEE